MCGGEVIAIRNIQCAVGDLVRRQVTSKPTKHLRLRDNGTSHSVQAGCPDRWLLSSGAVCLVSTKLIPSPYTVENTRQSRRVCIVDGPCSYLLHDRELGQERAGQWRLESNRTTQTRWYPWAREHGQTVRYEAHPTVRCSQQEGGVTRHVCICKHKPNPQSDIPPALRSSMSCHGAHVTSKSLWRLYARTSVQKHKLPSMSLPPRECACGHTRTRGKT